MIKGIQGKQINGEIQAIPSKSYAHRIAICNFLAGNEPVSGVKGFTSKDITVTEICLKNLVERKNVLDCGESGSTLRFLLPLTGVLGGEYEFIGHGKLMERPNEELFEVLNAHGVKTIKDKTIRTFGKLTAGEYRIRGDISSQYVSGLLMALPYLEGDSKIVLTTPLASAPYVDITLEVLKKFGVNIKKTDYGFDIKGNAKYNGKVLAEGDWSNSAFFLVLGCICGTVKVNGLNVDSVQGDRYITEIIKKAGGTIFYQGDSVVAQKSTLKGFTFDAENCPDLVPIACVLAGFSKGESVIKNISRLKIKESDRVETTISMLSSFGIKATTDGKDIVVYGGSPTNGNSESFNDHRIAMSSAIMGMGVQGESKILGAEAVTKSYPTFFEDLNKVGANSYDL